MTQSLSTMSLFLTVLLSGFYGGTGFFVRMGGNPAIRKMSDRTFAEYWQLTDFYMAARMKFFGPLLITCMFITVILQFPGLQESYFPCLLGSFLLLVADLVFVFAVNHPLNKLIKQWDITRLPGNVNEIKIKTVRAFQVRSALMIGSYLLLLCSLFLKYTG